MRRAPHSIEQRLADAAAFDDLPTNVVAVQEEKADPGESAVQMNTRPRRGVGSGPTVQVDEPTVTITDVPVVPRSKPDVSWLNDVTRLEEPPPPLPPPPQPPLPSVPLPAWSEPTAPGLARVRPEISRSSVIIRMTMGIVLAFIASMGLLSLLKRPAPVVAVPINPTASAFAAPARERASSKPAAVVAPSGAAETAPAVAQAKVAPDAPAPIAAGSTAAPVATGTEAAAASGGGDDEVAAVEAVASGDSARAARLYAGLAASHPTNEAYREAARILAEGSKESRR